MRSGQGSRARFVTVFPGRHRLEALGEVLGEPAQRGVEHQRATGGVAVLRVHVRRDLLQILHQADLELRERGQLIAKRRGGAFRCASRLPAGGGLAIDVIDEHRVERQLTLQVGADDSPDVAGQLRAKTRSLRRRRQDVPRLVERCDLMIIEDGRRERNRRRRADRTIQRGQRLVIARVSLVALVLQAPQDRLERLARMVGHQTPERPPAAAATGVMRPSSGLLADAYGRMGMRPAR